MIRALSSPEPVDAGACQGKNPQRKIGCRLRPLAFLGCFLLICFTLWDSYQSPRPVKIGITFAGYTTNAQVTFTTKQGTFPVVSATFCVSNLETRKVVQLGMVKYEFRHEPGSAEGGLFWSVDEFGGILQPGQSKTISLTTPQSTHGAWRAVFLFSRYGWSQRVREFPQWIQLLTREWVPENWLLNIPTQESVSDWVETEDQRGAPWAAAEAIQETAPAFPWD